MPWKNNNGDINETRPTRVRLPEADTRTAEAVTDEVLAESGWFWEEPVVFIPAPLPEVLKPVANQSSSGSSSATSTSGTSSSISIMSNPTSTLSNTLSLETLTLS
jgi:hypothetical protein